MAVDQQMRVRLWLFQHCTSEGQKVCHVILPWRDNVSALFVYDVMEAKVELCMLAESAECRRHRPVGIENGEDMADAGVTVAGQLINAADAGLEWYDGAHRQPFRRMRTVEL